MIEILDLDKTKFPTGFSAQHITAGEYNLPDKPYRGGFYHMFWVKNGSIIVNIDNQSFSVNKNECIFIGANQIFSFVPTIGFEIFLVCFTEAFYKRNSLDERFLESCMFFEPQVVKKYKVHSSLNPLIEHYHKSLMEMCGQPFEELIYQFAHNTIERLLLFAQKELITSTYSPVAVIKKTDQDIANHFRQLVKENCRQKKQVKFYADKLNISIKRLNDVCHTTFDMHPKKMITEQVVIEAKRLLQHSSMSVKEVAFDLMFLEPSNFIRFFIRSVNMSPTEYREMFRDKKEVYS